MQDYVETSQKMGKSRITDLFQRKYMRSLMIGVGMMVFNQFCGVNGVCYYMSSIFESIGFSSTLGSVVYSSFQVAMCSLTATRMDNTGRKPFLLVSESPHQLPTSWEFLILQGAKKTTPFHNSIHHEKWGCHSTILFH
uniref:Uncharacterized protein n=1 Tax=Kalanchoe fedtschenkoi TaxID=63787 RepID=A0A7N0UJW3_KALFE